MKRAILGELQRRVVLGLGVAAVLALVACTAPVDGPTQTPVEDAHWVTTPEIHAAERSGSGLVVSGLAAPSGRVAIRGAAGVAYATNADEEGRFVLRIAAPSADSLFVVETQKGQEAAPAPYRLLVTRDPDGPIALVSSGGPSQRLDPPGLLDVIDSDGRASLASGRGQPGGTASVSAGGRTIDRLPIGEHGRWVLPLDSQASVTVGGRAYARPGLPPSVSGEGLSISESGGGRMVAWTSPEGATQFSWFPNRIERTRVGD
jgi:hypothetical protein